jgi:hypothetical protein
MAEPSGPEAIIEALRSTGIPDAAISCKELEHGWRIRAQGGLIVSIRKNGQVTVSGNKTHAVRKALGLTSRRKPT